EALKRRISILEEFPGERFESIVVQWDRFRPSVFVQLRRDPREPIQFPGKRPTVAGNDALPADQPSALDLPLRNFVDAATGKLFEREAFNADILFSVNAFTVLQPEPDLVLPPQALWDCRGEALNALSVSDMAGIERVAGISL